MTQWLVLHPVPNPVGDRYDFLEAKIHGPYFYEEDARQAAESLGPDTIVVTFEPPNLPAAKE
jgi:hypothetical protein